MEIKSYCTRKTMLYPTGVEYGDYAMNHVQGCSHGCKYPCYAFLMKKRFGQVKDYRAWKTPVLVENTLDLLDVEIPRLRDKIKSVHLCFTTDPFMYGYPEIATMSQMAISKLNEAGIPCSVLTKGVLPEGLSNLPRLGTCLPNEYGITLVSLDEAFRGAYEPHTAPLQDRVESLYLLDGFKRTATAQRFKTWVSIEPFPTPNVWEVDLEKLLNRVSFVDKIVFGRMNYNPLVEKYPNYRTFYRECAKKVREFCGAHGIECWIKQGTEEDGR